MLNPMARIFSIHGDYTLYVSAPEFLSSACVALSFIGSALHLICHLPLPRAEVRRGDLDNCGSGRPLEDLSDLLQEQGHPLRGLVGFLRSNTYETIAIKKSVSFKVDEGKCIVTPCDAIDKQCSFDIMTGIQDHSRLHKSALFKKEWCVWTHLKLISKRSV